MTDEQTPNDEPIDNVSEPLNDSTEPLQSETKEQTKIDEPMTKENEPTNKAPNTTDKPAKKDTTTRAPKESKTPTEKPKKDYTILIVAVIALLLGAALLYLRNKRRTANAKINDDETTVDIPNETEDVNAPDLNKYFEQRSLFENPDYDGRN